MISEYTIGRHCMSEDDCIVQGVNFAGYERGVSDAAKAYDKALAAHAQAQPNTGDRDAYEGAREDLLIWKRRALEAEENTRQLLRALAAEVNGPTFMGEPVSRTAQAQPVVPTRSDKDYAIEHAEYMAKAAERLLESMDEEFTAQENIENADDGVNKYELESALDEAHANSSEARRTVVSRIYEFRKRRDRAASHQPAPQPEPTAAQRHSLAAYIAANYPDAEGDTTEEKAISALEKMDAALGMKELPDKSAEMPEFEVAFKSQRQLPDKKWEDVSLVSLSDVRAAWKERQS